MAPEPVSVLFVCLGNICRSTMAEGVLQHMAKKPPYDGLVGRVDSCGTGAYHVGDGPDDRAMETLEQNGVTDYWHCARKINMHDFDNFDYIFAMDKSNLDDLKRLQRNNPESRAKVMLFGDPKFTLTGKTEIIQDPYYGPLNGFDRTFEQCQRLSRNFLQVVFPDAKEPGKESASKQ